jgi:hypothetical protein
MNCYRIFLLRLGMIAAHHEFHAESDDWGCRAAALAFDACTEHCDDFELWDGVHLVTTRAGLKTRTIIASPDVASAGSKGTTQEGAIERIAVGIIEAAIRNSGPLRDSPRLDAGLSALRRLPAGSR